MGGLPRRQVLTSILLVPAALAGGLLGGCGRREDDRPDPLPPLAAQARADAALAAAVLAAEQRAPAQVESVRAARAAHADALQAEIARLRPQRGTPGASGADLQSPATVAALREALERAQHDAEKVALTAAADRVGLVCSVAACCGAYAELLR